MDIGSLYGLNAHFDAIQRTMIQVASAPILALIGPIARRPSD